jgi:hypothetical protein
MTAGCARSGLHGTTCAKYPRLPWPSPMRLVDSAGRLTRRFFQVPSVYLASHPSSRVILPPCAPTVTMPTFAPATLTTSNSSSAHLTRTTHLTHAQRICKRVSSNLFRWRLVLHSCCTWQCFLPSPGFCGAATDWVVTKMTMTLPPSSGRLPATHQAPSSTMQRRWIAELQSLKVLFWQWVGL